MRQISPDALDADAPTNMIIAAGLTEQLQPRLRPGYDHVTIANFTGGGKKPYDAQIWHDDNTRRTIIYVSCKGKCDKELTHICSFDCTGTGIEVWLNADLNAFKSTSERVVRFDRGVGKSRKLCAAYHAASLDYADPHLLEQMAQVVFGTEVIPLGWQEIWGLCALVISGCMMVGGFKLMHMAFLIIQDSVLKHQ